MSTPYTGCRYVQWVPLSRYSGCRSVQRVSSRPAGVREFVRRLVRFPVGRRLRPPQWRSADARLPRSRYVGRRPSAWPGASRRTPRRCRQLRPPAPRSRRRRLVTSPDGPRDEGDPGSLLLLGLRAAYILGLMRPRMSSRYGPFVTWRLVVVDVVVATAAFGLSAAVLAGSDPVAAELREPDAFAYVLLAVYSRRRSAPKGAGGRRARRACWPGSCTRRRSIPWR